MTDSVSKALTFERLENWLFGAFAALALLLATVGLYGLISHEVEVSTRDIGVRVALGATRTRILGLVYRRVGLMFLTGTRDRPFRNLGRPPAHLERDRHPPRKQRARYRRHRRCFLPHRPAGRVSTRPPAPPPSNR